MNVLEPSLGISCERLSQCFLFRFSIDELGRKICPGQRASGIDDLSHRVTLERGTHTDFRTPAFSWRKYRDYIVDPALLQRTISVAAIRITLHSSAYEIPSPVLFLNTH